MKIEIEYTDKRGDNDGTTHDVKPLSRNHIIDFVNQRAHASFGDRRITVKVDGEPFDMMPSQVKAMQGIGGLLLGGAL